MRARTHLLPVRSCIAAEDAAACARLPDTRESVTFSDARADGGSNYGTALIGNRSLEFVRRALAADVPFFAYIAPHAPHEPATPAPWYAELYGEAIAPRTAAWNVSSGDKHWVVAVQAALTAEFVEAKIDSFYRNRLRRHCRHPPPTPTKLCRSEGVSTSEYRKRASQY